MIIGIGIDATEIARFSHWHTYSATQLGKIFSDAEIAYCLKIPAKSAERFAARFAVREAFLKAITMATGKNCPLFTLCKAVTVSSAPNGQPSVQIDWNLLSILSEPVQWHVTITHTKTTAMAVIVIERKTV